MALRLSRRSRRSQHSHVRQSAPVTLLGSLRRNPGVNIETIRYYERVGLLPAPARTTGGRRTYDSADVRRLAFIRRARDLGFAMADIRSLLDLGDPRQAECQDVCAVAEPHLARVRDKITSLQRLEAELAHAIDRCGGSGGPYCGVIEALCPETRELTGGT